MATCHRIEATLLTTYDRSTPESDRTAVPTAITGKSRLRRNIITERILALPPRGFALTLRPRPSADNVLEFRLHLTYPVFTSLIGLRGKQLSDFT